MFNNRKRLFKMERIAARAWPAQIEEKYGAWLLRAHDGISKRANSVLTLGELPSRKDWLPEIEAFYRKRSLDPCFYLTDLSSKKVATYLLKEHYQFTTQLYILAVEQASLVENTIENRLEIRMFEEVTSTWMDNFLYLEGHEEKNRSAYQSIFKAIPMEKAFISLYEGELAVAVATIAGEDGWAYVSNVVVHQAYRRRGIARMLFHILASWAYDHGYGHLFMQVLANNHPALHLYDRLGFQQEARSYYMTKPRLRSDTATERV